jgi:subtilase family serine protease
VLEGRWFKKGIALACAMVALGLLSGTALAAGPKAGAARVGSAPPAQKLQLVFPLKANLAGLERFATAVTTVGSPQYGDFEPIAVLARRFGASTTTRAGVLRYLARAGASRARIDATGLFADATMTVRLAQRLFATSLARYQGARQTRFVAPSSAARVPAALRGAVTAVVGLDTRSLVATGRSMVARTAHFTHAAAQVGSDQQGPSGYGLRTGHATGCAGALGQRGFDPNQYLTAYDYAPLQAAGVTGQGERVALIEIDGFRYQDLRSFAKCFLLAVPAINGYGVGLARPLAPGGETTLDLEVLDATAPDLKGIDVYESQARASDVLLSLTAPLQNRGHVPEVISASLGVCEPSLELAIGRSGVRTAEGALALAAASGISIMASSGDAGSSACVGRTGPLDGLADSYPASSPYVTGVGGTNVTLNSANQILNQPVWNDAPYNPSAGGGGSSGLFLRPSYQKGFVSSNRRGVPDVSMLADVLPGYNIFCTARGDCINSQNSNPWVPVGGTSAASPLFAGGIALVDETLREHGKQNLGLANPLLYKLDRGDAATHVISDVVTGDNDLGAYLSGGNHKPLGCCTAGAGYDLASGLGSVDLAKFAFLATATQPAIAQVGISLPRQRPVARHHVLAKLSCSRRCIVEALGVIAIPGARSIRLSSSMHLLLGKGRRTVQLDLSAADRGRLRRGLRAHKRIYATVAGAIVDSGGNVERLSRGQRLHITG